MSGSSRFSALRIRLMRTRLNLSRDESALAPVGSRAEESTTPLRACASARPTTSASERELLLPCGVFPYGVLDFIARDRGMGTSRHRIVRGNWTLIAQVSWQRGVRLSGLESDSAGRVSNTESPDSSLPTTRRSSSASCSNS